MEDAIAITPRQLNTLIKVSKARAQLHLRDTVWASDAEASIRMISHCLEQVGIDPVRCSYDIDVLYTGRPTVLNGKLLKVVEVFSELEKQSIPVHRSSLESILWERYGMTSRTVSRLLRSLLMEGIITEDPPGEYRRREWGQGDA
jgi:replicative DNA helicase Mcm